MSPHIQAAPHSDTPTRSDYDMSQRHGGPTRDLHPTVRRVLESRRVLGVRVDATNHGDALERILGWAHGGQSRYVCVASVNNVMVARRDPKFLRVMNDADLVTPDGRPLVWALRWFGIESATQVRGTDLTIALLQKAAEEDVAVAFYGGKPETLARLLERVRERWPRLRVPYAHSPPFRPLTKKEDESVVRDINNSGAGLVFVGLGCPKQEQWMAEHRDRLPAAMVGVGAAFDFLAGEFKEAPLFLQRAGLEWSFRLAQDPRRLWKRYLRQNPVFISRLIAEVAARRISGSRTGRSD